MKKSKNAENRVVVYIYIYIYIDILSKIWNAFAKEKECTYLNANKLQIRDNCKNKKDNINSTFCKICVQIE